MKAYTFRVFNKAVRRARASRRTRGRAPEGRHVDDDRCEVFFSKLTPSPFLPTTAGGMPVQPRVAGHGAGKSQTIAKPIVRCRARLETCTTTHHR